MLEFDRFISEGFGPEFKSDFEWRSLVDFVRSLHDRGFGEYWYVTEFDDGGVWLEDEDFVDVYIDLKWIRNKDCLQLLMFWIIDADNRGFWQKQILKEVIFTELN